MGADRDMTMRRNVWDRGHRRIVWSDGQVCRLSATEAALLQYLLDHAGQVVSRQELLQQIWGITALPARSRLKTRTVDMHISRLRAKLRHGTDAGMTIQTVRGSGYRLTLSHPPLVARSEASVLSPA